MEKNFRPPAPWFQERHARCRSTSSWWREVRIYSGLSWSGEHQENVASPATAATEASWVLGARRCSGLWRIIVTRHGFIVFIVAPVHEKTLHRGASRWTPSQNH